ncbi:S8 family serine peptidase [Microbacterium sp. 2FI]|uniref:S8 family serine peptidase n=1 Tax=Microbacterium sp. 2FI TaxID=2502193 RepID=UPI0010F4EB9E|nr:S8 family serine peptidase [Microbacterium sp. 2FI]
MNENTLSVSVTAYDRTPIAGAQVTRTGEDRSTETRETDERGYVRFDAPPTEPARVTVIAPGFAPDERAIGNGYPTQPDGVEPFVLGPAGWPAYFRGRVRIPFRPITDAVGVRLAEPLEGPGEDDALKAIDGLEETPTDTIRFDDPSVVVVRVPEAPGDTDEVVRRMDARSAEQGLGQVGALVTLTETGASFLTDTMTVSFLDADADAVEVASRHGLEVVKQFRALGSTYVFRSPAGAGYDLLDKVAAVAAEPGVRYAEPSLIHTAEVDAVTPNDFLFPQQWDHRLIRTPDAWQVLQNIAPARTFGDASISIAVVDNGVDVTHPAMAATLSDGTAKVSQLFDFVRMAADNTSTVDGDHGMACASAAAGASNNAEGQAGIAGNCHVMGIRRGGDEVRYSEMYLWLAGLDADSATAGFPTQLADGADVITNSIAFSDSVGDPISALMQDTFDAVADQGRGGRGTVLFFSAGNVNQDLDVSFHRPWSMYGRCYGVSASTLAADGVNEVKSDYSSFGSTVDFCAPSNDTFAPVIHNPNAQFGAFSATRADAPEGTAIPGTAASATTLSAASAAGAMAITVASVAGAAVGGSVLVGPVANATSRGRTITAVNAATRVVTLDRALPAAFANGTAVAFAPHLYRSDFGGTSYATPVTAGVAALMLSANPQLSWEQVGDILRATAVKIDPNNTDATGRWRDGANRISTDPAYAGPVTSEWYGSGRIDAAAAVTRAAWTIDRITDAVEFIDVPEGETTYRAVRFDVHSLYGSTFTTTGVPAAPFGMPAGQTESLSGTADYAVVQEAYLWVAYTGTAAGDTAAGSITVRHDQTGAEWTIPIAANTVARKTACVMLVLDRSGSMDFPSGVGTSKRIDVLRYSAGILAEAVHEGDGVGIVAFDHDPSTVLTPPVGPLAEPTLFDPVRDQVRSAITTFAVNMAGATSIGDGLEIGQSELNPVGGYDIKASVVFTDGYENSERWIADVGPSITDRTYAVALGRAENIRPATLTSVTNDTGGYCVLTDELNNDSRYKLAKYFLQVLAGVKNDQIVVDPPVTVPLGDTVDVPFELAETDFVADVILLTQHPELIEMTLLTPAGDLIDPAFMAGLGGRNYVKVGDNIVYYRLTIPAPIGSGAHEGTWHARLHLPKDAVKRARRGEKKLTPEELEALMGKGLEGVVLVHASSNLRMGARIRQDSFEPGAKVLLSADLTEYDVPVERRAEIEALVTAPSGSQFSIPLAEVGPGLFEEALAADEQGVWTVLFRARGKTFRGSPFTREEVRTVAVWKGGDSYEPKEEEEPRGKSPRRQREAWELLLRDPKLVSQLSRRLAAAGLVLDDVTPAER